MPHIPINVTPEDKLMRSLEFEAYNDNIWYDMIISIRDRTMSREVYNQVRRSLRSCLYSIKNLCSR